MAKAQWQRPFFEAIVTVLDYLIGVFRLILNRVRCANRLLNEYLSLVTNQQPLIIIAHKNKPQLDAFKAENI